MPFGARWWDLPIFFPMQGALALSEHLAGVAVISSPVQLLGGTPVLGYNIALIASYTLSAWFAFALVQRLTGSTAAAMCAGVAYGFAPYRAGQLAHLQVLTSQWLPLLLLAMHAYLDDGRRRWLIVAGLAWLVQGLSNGYYLLFTPVLAALWLLWFPRWGRDARRGLSLVGTLIVASFPFVPLLLKYRAVHDELGLTRPESEIAAFSAQLSSFLNPPHLLALWAPRAGATHENYLFPGITVVLILTAAIVVCVARGTLLSAVRARSPLTFYGLAAVAMVIFSLGPGSPDAGAWRWIRPYYWLTLLPGYGSLRVPSRFAMLSTLCASIAVGLVVGWVRERQNRRLLVAVAVIAGLLADGWMEPLPLLAPPGRQLLTDVPPDAVVLELPADETLVSVNAMYRALYHRRPLVNGYSGHFPPHYAILTQALRRQDPSAIMELARGRTLVILVSDRFDPAGDFKGLVASLPGVMRSGSGSGGALYVLPAQPRERVAASGTAIPATWTALPREHAMFDLGGTRIVRTIEFPLRWHYPELGERLAVETSEDGVRWQIVWEHWTAGRALAGALENQRLAPFRIPLPDVAARYVRIHPAPAWMVRELRVLGP